MKNKEALREQVRQAMEELADQQDAKQINLTDAEARLMKTRQGMCQATTLGNGLSGGD